MASRPRFTAKFASSTTRLFLTLAFLTAVPLFVLCFHSSAPTPSRGPASDIYNDNGELVMSEESIASISRTRDDGTRLKAPSRRPFVGGGRDLSESEAERRAGHRVSRAREVHLDFQAFREAVKTSDRLVIFTLFPDTEVYVHLRVPSVLRVNQGVYSGIVDDDEGSQVHLFAADGELSGVIETSTKRYRLLSHPDGRETVTEELITR